MPTWSQISPYFGGFVRNPYRFIRHKFHEHPSYTWACFVGGVPTVMLVAMPSVRRALGYEDTPPRPQIPGAYPLPKRARQPVPSKYDD